jgi:hypothetical protein
MITKLASDIIASARPATRHDTDTQVTDAQLLIWLGEHVRALHSMAARICKSQYTLTALFTVASGTTSVTVGSAPLAGVAANTYLDFRGIDFDLGNSAWMPLKPLSFRGRGTADARRYLLRGDTIDLYPTTNTAGNYRLWYIATPFTVTTPVAGTSLALPEGGDLWLAEQLGARIRVRFQQNPQPHLDLAKMYWDAIIRPWLLTRNNADTQVIAHVEEENDDFGFFP